MKRLTVIAFLVVLAACSPLSQAVLSDAECDRIAAAQKTRADKTCAKYLEEGTKDHLIFAFSALWLNQRVDEGNERLRQFCKDLLGDDPAMTPEKAVGVKWNLSIWLRLYYLFYDKSEHFPGRLETDVQEKLEEIFWNYGYTKSHLKRLQSQYVWCIGGSENHDIMDYCNAFMCLEIVKDLPKYQDLVCEDGFRAAQHCAAGTEYYKLYCAERAKNGLFIEVASPGYSGATLPVVVNLCDFAEDPLLRTSARMLLHVAWADWAIDQLGGVRGGGKTRVYQGKNCNLATADSYLAMSSPLFDLDLPLGNWRGFIAFAASSYRAPNVVIDLARNPDERGSYVYKSVRPGKMVDGEDAKYIWIWGGKMTKTRPTVLDGVMYDLDPIDTRFVRYGYCTPDYIIGSLWLEPSFGTAFRLAFDLDYAPYRNYSAITSQNQWQGIIFPTDINARVFPQCKGSYHNTHTLTFNQHVAVQHENVMLVQKNRGGYCGLEMRIFFSDGMKDRLVERDGWLFLQEGAAYLAVQPLPRLCDETMQGYTWDDDNWLRCRDEYAPVVFVTGRNADHADLDAFIAYVAAHQFTVKTGILDYTFADTTDTETTLTMYLETIGLPEINGQPIDLQPKTTYESPYLAADRRSGVITITKDARKMTLDFDNLTITEQ